MSRPFRFAATPPEIRQPLAGWQDALHRIEDLGVDTLVLADHFTEGWTNEPMVGLTAAALSTTRIKLQTGVLSNDYRHPVLVHRMAALLDVVSGGRLVLGLGAGWLRSDYAAAGIALDSPGKRIERLSEAIAIIKGLFGPEPFSHAGHHYTIDGLVGRPEPAQRPRPRIFLGGGGPRMLRLAGREADIVGVNAIQSSGALGRPSIVDLFHDPVAKKLEWLAEGMRERGRAPAEVELEMNLWLARVTSSESEARLLIARVAERYAVDPDLLGRSPSVLVGTVPQCIDRLEEIRGTLGFSCFQLDAGFPARDLERFGPLIRGLAGR